MSCLSPLYVTLNKGEDNERLVQVRCRECEDCKQSSRSSAVVRMHYEDLKCKQANGMIFFFTLTFADEYVPFKFHRMCFDKKLIQNWLQSFRQMMRRHYGYRVKYFIVSELGHVGTHRPHHHGKLYLYPDTKYQLKEWREGGKRNHEIPWFPASYASIIKHAWCFGRADVSEFDPSKGGNDYVSKYISKDVEEENLFKDILTRIKIKRGKGNPKTSVKYYSYTFPSLFNFTNRYCAFTMISKGLGDFYNPSRKDLVECKPVEIDGFQYACPRYYTDRYIRKEQMVATEKITTWSYKTYVDRMNKFALPSSPWYVIPSQKVLNRYCREIPSDVLFEVPKKIYEDVPFYKLSHPRYRYDSDRIVKVIPKVSEVSTLSAERKAFLQKIDQIENLYFALPSILRDSCNYDVVSLLHDVPKLVDSDSVICWTREGSDMIQELKELTRLASEWRAKSRIAKREQSRKDKIALNTPYAHKPLTWDEYKRKSNYFKFFVK